MMHGWAARPWRLTKQESPVPNRQEPGHAICNLHPSVRFRAYMAQAETLGFESAWTLEHTLGTMPFMSPLQTMSYAAACTERIRLGCVVFVTPLHSPVHLAKDLTTLDQLSRGRIEIAPDS